MLAQPEKAVNEPSDYEKDRLAWNLPRPVEAPPSPWRRLTAPPIAAPADEEADGAA